MTITETSRAERLYNSVFSGRSRGFDCVFGGALTLANVSLAVQFFKGGSPTQAMLMLAGAYKTGEMTYDSVRLLRQSSFKLNKFSTEVTDAFREVSRIALIAGATCLALGGAWGVDYVKTRVSEGVTGAIAHKAPAAP